MDLVSKSIVLLNVLKCHVEIPSPYVKNEGPLRVHNLNQYLYCTVNELPPSSRMQSKDTIILGFVQIKK